MITFSVCPHDTEKGLKNWLEISEKIKQIFNQEVVFEPFKNFYQEYVFVSLKEFKPDIYYASFDITLKLLEKDYKIIGKFKDSLDRFLLITLKNQKELKSISIIDKLSSYIALYEADLYDKEIIISGMAKSFEDSLERLLEKKADAALVFEDYYKGLDQKIKNKIEILREITLDLSHYFLVSTEFYENNLENIKRFIQELNLQELSEENVNKIKEHRKFGKMLKNSLIKSFLIESLTTNL